MFQRSRMLKRPISLLEIPVLLFIYALVRRIVWFLNSQSKSSEVSTCVYYLFSPPPSQYVIALIMLIMLTSVLFVYLASLPL